MLAFAKAAFRLLNHLTELDELRHGLAALDDFERVFLLNLARFLAFKIAARTHAIKKPRSLHALLETAYKVKRALAFVFLHLGVYHRSRTIAHPSAGRQQSKSSWYPVVPLYTNYNILYYSIKYCYATQ